MIIIRKGCIEKQFYEIFMWAFKSGEGCYIHIYSEFWMILGLPQNITCTWKYPLVEAWSRHTQTWPVAAWSLAGWRTVRFGVMPAPIRAMLARLRGSRDVRRLTGGPAWPRPLPESDTDPDKCFWRGFLEVQTMSLWCSGDVHWMTGGPARHLRVMP